MAEGSKGDTEDSWLGSAASSPSLLASEIERDSWIALKKIKREQKRREMNYAS